MIGTWMNRFNFIFSVTSQLAKIFDEKQLEKMYKCVPYMIII